VCWLYFGGSSRPIDPGRDDGEVDRFPVNTLALSGYRPDPIIARIARKRVRLPYDARGAKPPYMNVAANRSQEVLHQAPGFAMGTLYSPDRGVRTVGTILPQTTMFKLLTRGCDDVLAFGMANGYHGHFPLEGRGPYDQYHQVGSAAVMITWVGENEDARTRHRSLFGWSRAAGAPRQHGDWYVWETPGAYVGARPLNGRAEPGVPTKVDKKTKEPVPVKDAGFDYLVSPGKLGGWVVQALDRTHLGFTDADLFAQRLAGCDLDLSRFDADRREVTFTTLAGRELRIRHTGGPGGRPGAWVDGTAVDYERFLVYDSPFVRQVPGSGILDINDGRNGLRIDVNQLPPRRRRYTK
jgi:hypothetical protein